MTYALAELVILTVETGFEDQNFEFVFSFILQKHKVKNFVFIRGGFFSLV